MIYVIIGAVAAFVLLLLFWDDHDSSYNRGDGRSRYSRKASEKRAQPQARQPQQEAPRAEFKSEPKVEFGSGQKSYWAGGAEDVDEQEPLEQEEPLKEGERYEDEEKMDLSFLNTLEYDEDLEENTDTFDVTGLRYHCTVLDRGPIVGYVKPEPTNPHDSRAQAVFLNDGKLLGYIPRTQQDWYEEFNKQNVVCPYVGEITMNNRGLMLGEVKAILPVNKEFVQEEIVKGL